MRVMTEAILISSQNLAKLSLRVTHMYIVEMKEKTITHFLFMFQFLQSQSHRSRTHPPYCLPNETDMWPVRHGAFLKLDK